MKEEKKKKNQETKQTPRDKSRNGKAATSRRTPRKSKMPMDWPHAPKHWLFDSGTYMVTAGTYRKQHHLNTPERLDFFLKSLFDCATEFGWELRAWAVLSNHYHFLALSPENPATLRKMLTKLHMTTAKQLNIWDNQPGRKVWHQYWDSQITFERSYLARLHYVHSNPEKHGVAGNAENYDWCSAAWFFRNAEPAFIKTVQTFKTDKLEIPDDF
jgi:putative transposase